MKRTLIVDGDIVLFQIGRVTEDSTDFGDQLMESYDHESAVRLINKELDDIAKKTGYDREEIVFAISSDTNFRKKHFPTYKGNRKNIRKPLGLKHMRQYMLDEAEQYQTVMIEDLEADDVMGMYGTADPKDVGDIAIYSQDKDLFTIPIKQWCFKKRKFIYPTHLESIRFLYTQVGTGDVVDGYKGCPKIGKVKAERILAGCKNEAEMLENMHKTYFNEYGSKAKEELLKQVGQARISHQLDAQMLMMYDITYNPYDQLSISDQQIQEWEAGCEEFVRNVISQKKKEQFRKSKTA